ncbi:YybH family protein [Mangrovibacterium lignilyticum]|uniref:YybH family protein n=1 Tax=Mangrovibacterium lignilyticum TaxID=2668052 RepID=UPI0013D48828|nr:nuclear transport factor 2 family protein [Mangrovibacterium lignilyticum]
MANEEDVRKASQEFYKALNLMVNGNAEALKVIWSHSEQATTMHPVGGRQVGWNDVWNTWNQVAQVSSDGKVELEDQLIFASGDLAYETGVENAGFKVAGTKTEGQVRVTNVYRKENGSWKIVHHHTDLVPAMVEAVSKLQAGAKESAV